MRNEKAFTVHQSKEGSYYLLTRKEMYVDLGEDYFDKQRQQSIFRHSLRRLESLGYTVTLQEPEAS